MMKILFEYNINEIKIVDFDNFTTHFFIDYVDIHISKLGFEDICRSRGLIMGNKFIQYSCLYLETF